MKVASASNPDDLPAAGAAKAAAAKPPAKPTASRGSRGKARKPIYADSNRSASVPMSALGGRNEPQSLVQPNYVSNALFAIYQPDTTSFCLLSSRCTALDQAWPHIFASS